MMIVDSYHCHRQYSWVRRVLCSMWELMSLGLCQFHRERKVEVALRGFWLQCIQSSPYGHEYSELLDKLPTDLGWGALGGA